MDYPAKTQTKKQSVVGNAIGVGIHGTYYYTLLNRRAIGIKE
jgi:hypothetical protein